MQDKEDSKNRHPLNNRKDLPPFKAAIAQFQDKSKIENIKALKAGKESDYDNYKLKIEFGSRRKFENILDFFVNLPSVERDLKNESVTNKWSWQPIEPQPLSKQFYYRSEILSKLKANAGADDMILDGWMVRYTYGRIDGETTWSDASYLFSANSYYAYIQIYTEQDH